MRSKRESLLIIVLTLPVCTGFLLAGSDAQGVVSTDQTSNLQARCPGDFNDDGLVNLFDFLAFAGGFGAESGDANYNAAMDMDGSGGIELSDFLAFLAVFGTTCDGQPGIDPIAGDRAALVALYQVTDGPNWVNNDGWLTDAPLRNWHGVDTDASGRVVTLNLDLNGLVGRMPPELGSLSELRILTIRRQVGLTGPIPGTLGNLANLERLTLDHTNLTGLIPRELGSLANLRWLRLDQNNLTGPIPPELGNLLKLDFLSLGYCTEPTQVQREGTCSQGDHNYPNNRLTGSIPSELGSLKYLSRLLLSGIGLTGSIPTELGQLSGLEWLQLAENDLTGILPAALGGLHSLEKLEIWGNELTGSVPPEIGNSARLEVIDLRANALTGPLPAELGDLPKLARLHLANNGLSGPIPREFGRLASLETLSIEGNREMSGALPARLTALGRLSAFAAGGTGLCAPADDVFLEWLANIPRRRVALCREEGQSATYLIQSAQSRAHPVPLVAGRPALLRVFVTAPKAAGVGIPPVRTTLYDRSGREHVITIPGKEGSITAQVDEGDLAKSANVDIPGELIQPGLEIVIEIDPQGTVDSSLAVARRIPETGSIAVEVHEMPTLDLTLIPMLRTDRPDSAAVRFTEGLTAEDVRLSPIRTLLPVGNFEVSVHEPVLYSPGNDIRDMVQVIRVMDGGAGHFMAVTPDGGGSAFGNRVSFARADPYVMAHELGHNMNLKHAPCGGAGIADDLFPYADGSSGVWGFDRDRGALVSPWTPDLMSYCVPQWISDYHFTNALRFRLADEGTPKAAKSVTAPVRALLLWGGVDAEGVPYLQPSFVVDVAPRLPGSAGKYTVTGRSADGDEQFSLSFAMPEVADGDGSSSFAFALPVSTGWIALASITLSGPGGSVKLDRDCDLGMVILRSARTGRVRGFLKDRDLTRVALKAATVDDDVVVHVSRGIQDVEAWRW